MHLITNRRVYIPSKFGVDFPAIAPENWWLGNDPFLLGAKGPFSGAFAVSLREGRWPEWYIYLIWTVAKISSINRMLDYTAVCWKAPLFYHVHFLQSAKEQLTSSQGMRRLTGFLQIAQKLHRQELGKRPWGFLGTRNGGKMVKGWKTQPT